MSLDEKIYTTLREHMLQDPDIFGTLAVLTSHISLIIQSCAITPEMKINLAKQCMACVVEEIQKDPFPLRGTLN